MAASQAALDLLPTELIASIAEHVTQDDLCSLHFVSKTVSAATEPAYIEAFFARRSHLITCQSMQDLIDITAHPRLGKKIKELALIPRSLQESEFKPGYRDDYNDFYYSEEQTYVLRMLSEECLRARGHDDYIREQVWPKWLAEQEAVERELPAMLLEVFENLSGGMSAAAIRLGPGNSPEHGWRSLSRLLSVPEPLSDEHLIEVDNNDGIGRTLLTALAQSQLGVSELALGNSAVCYTEFGFSLFQPVDPSTPKMLCSLATSLQSFEISFDESIYKAVAGSDWYAFASFVQSALKLEKLRLVFSVEYTGDNTDVGAIIGLFGAANLRSIAITWGDFMGDDMRALLSAHRSTLRVLQLDYCTVLSPGCWTQLMAWMAENPELENIMFKAGVGDLPTYKDICWNYSGKEQVQKELMHHAYSPMSELHGY